MEPNDNFLAATRRAKSVRKKNRRAIGQKKPKSKPRPKGQAVLYQAMPTKREKQYQNQKKFLNTLDEQFARRMKEIKEEAKYDN